MAMCAPSRGQMGVLGPRQASCIVADSLISVRGALLLGEGWALPMRGGWCVTGGQAG